MQTWSKQTGQDTTHMQKLGEFEVELKTCKPRCSLEDRCQKLKCAMQRQHEKTHKSKDGAYELQHHVKMTTGGLALGKAGNKKPSMAKQYMDRHVD